MIHTLLARQLKRLSLEYDKLPTDIDDWTILLERISKAYFDSDQERYLMERSLQISSREMQERWLALDMEKAKALHAEKYATLGEMAGGIAHEINNPIGLIAVLTAQLKELIAEGSVDNDILSDFLNQIETSAWRIAKIVKAMRGFSRDGSNDPFLSVPVKKIIDDVVVFCTERFKQHGVTLSISEVDDTARVECRDVEIVQVLLNLLNNAFDAIEGLNEKWIKLAVDESPTEVTFSVTNSGAKIPADIGEKLFQPFFTTKEVGKGTGLGLSISKKIAENHGGSLIYDKQCEDCRFVLTISKNNRVTGTSAA